MVQQIRGIGVGLSKDALDELDTFANAKGVSRSEAARAAITLGLPLLNLGLAFNAERALTILEHTQLALSLLVEKQCPEDVTTIIDQAYSNVREFHG